MEYDGESTVPTKAVIVYEEGDGGKAIRTKECGYCR